MLQQSKELKSVLPDVDITENVGRTSSFEVTVDEKYVAYSKLTKGNFPDFKIVAKEISDFAKSGTAPSTWSTK